MLYMVAITSKTHTDAFLQLMMHSALCFFGGGGGEPLANAASTTSVVPLWWMFVDDHFSVGQQYFQSL
jgi:hypothetical protein